ncbi:MAG: lysine exporter LysO family protein [Muribaculaceae bacterium]|nr:lysine exporter LysO family protein [Muribaculaceae bacterium]
MKGSLIVALIFAAGVLIGIYATQIQSYIPAELSEWLLYALVIHTGIALGFEIFCMTGEMERLALHSRFVDGGSSGHEMMPIAIMHGVVLELCVPLLVTLFASI